MADFSFRKAKSSASDIPSRLSWPILASVPVIFI